MLFTGGGTGGHVFPGLAVLDELRRQFEVDAVWVGGTTGMEREIVCGRVRYLAIPTGKLRRYLSVRNVGDVFRVAAGLLRSIQIIRRLKPAVVFSKGGFVSVPPVVAAGILGVPVVSHESDADPGLATRINARFSAAVCVAYEPTKMHFSAPVRERVIVTGNPVRPEIRKGSREAGLKLLGFTADDPRPVVLFLGGSLGARQINELVNHARPAISGLWRVVHQTGDSGPEQRTSDYYAARFFRDELADVLAAADLVVCRAGASTLWEAAALGLPMLLVPLTSGSRGDQVRNAAVFERHGAARSFGGGTLASDVQEALLRYAADRDSLACMGSRARSLVDDHAVERIVALLAGYIRRSG